MNYNEITILIVDDEKDLLVGLKRSLELELDSKIIITDTGSKALKKIQEKSVDIVLTDISMPQMDGVTLLKKIIALDPSVTVIMMTAYGTIELAVKTLHIGAYDFIQKPFEEENLVRILKKAIERSYLIKENRELQKKISEKEPFNKLVGKSAPMKNVFNKIDMLGKTDVTVLITGETGTGKDIAAHVIHSVSTRREKPFVTVNCPALPDGLLESELFGHKKGAFTNADKDKKGMFDAAQGGTIFLDEIGDLSLSLQTKLLRVLQNREIKPLGAEKSHLVDTRIIAATNQDLIKKVENKEFRADLFYRLNVAALRMPNLNEIKEDIPLLVEHFLKKAAHDLGTSKKSITSDLFKYILTRRWPGNVRELENTLTGWCALSAMEIIDKSQITTELEIIECDTSSLDTPYKLLKQRVIDEFTKSYLKNLLASTNGNVSKAAEKSGIKRQSLQKIIKRYEINADLYRE